jgi:hypothetical protein
VYKAAELATKILPALARGMAAVEHIYPTYSLPSRAIRCHDARSVAGNTVLFGKLMGLDLHDSKVPGLISAKAVELLGRHADVKLSELSSKKPENAVEKEFVLSELQSLLKELNGFRRDYPAFFQTSVSDPSMVGIVDDRKQLELLVESVNGTYMRRYEVNYFYPT